MRDAEEPEGVPSPLPEAPALAGIERLGSA